MHNQEWAGGPAKAAAEWCGQPDNEQYQNTTIREISAHDTVFSRRNLGDPQYIDFLWHRSATTNQLYYVGNEPEYGSTLSNNITCPSNCWNPRDRYIDGHISGCFPNPDSQFWELQDDGGNPLPMDILVSEMGPHWYISQDRPGLEWSGGWPGFCTGLTWWNTYLCWLTRQGPLECNLQNWESGLHTIHACIHSANLPPFATSNAPNHQRNQWYFNSDTWSTHVYNNANMLKCTQLVNETNETTSQTFENSFSAFNTISWDGRTWRSTPFGVCYTVWSNVGPDPISGNLATGWVSSTQSGVVGSASINLPSGYSTVYFPIIKNMGAFTAGTQINIRWIRPSDGAVHDRGFMDMRDFSNSGIYYYYGLTQYTYAAMVYPVVCYASTARTVTVQLSRNISGTQIWLGRPIVLPGACSWFITQ